jgi:hypothetical protein
MSERGLVMTRPILVFGSAPLQIYLDPAFLSADVDVAVSEREDELKALVEEIGLGKGQATFYVEVVPAYIFRAGQKWRERARTVTLEGVAFLFPEPMDILLAKLRRLDEKDLRAFELVREKTGHPTEEELIGELRDAYDLFYFQRDGRKSLLWSNTEKLWPRLFGHAVDVPACIIQPVLEQLAAAGCTRDYLEELRRRFGL